MGGCIIAERKGRIETQVRGGGHRVNEPCNCRKRKKGKLTNEPGPEIRRISDETEKWQTKRRGHKVNVLRRRNKNLKREEIMGKRRVFLPELKGPLCNSWAEGDRGEGKKEKHIQKKTFGK